MANWQPPCRGHNYNDLLVNLLKAYTACSDQTFVKDISNVQTRCEHDGTLTPNELMQKAAHRLKILKNKDF